MSIRKEDTYDTVWRPHPAIAQIPRWRAWCTDERLERLNCIRRRADARDFTREEMASHLAYMNASEQQQIKDLVE
jgi:hypothetical protein